MKEHKERAKAYPELTMDHNGKTIKSIDYRWKGNKFVVIDKNTGVEHRFTKKSLIGFMFPDQDTFQDTFPYSSSS